MFEAIFRGLNEGQRAAVEAVRGPVCILAGAGSGKTTTITRRIAHQVAAGAFSAGEVLAVTFTDKAAKEMGGRLRALGVPTVRARTFHAEALAQFHQLTNDTTEILGSKVQILRSLVQRLPMPHRFTAIRDIAGEIERAKSRMIAPERYREMLGEHTPPVPPELMLPIFVQYERRKAKAGLIDFEDLLGRTVEVLSTKPEATAIVRERYRAFTVDEYQDVNPLQQALLEAWTGDREDLCVVGDDYQSIYSFTGASATYLLEFPKRYPGAQTVRLTLNYRSTPGILEASNRLVPSLHGSSKVLEPTRPDGEPPVFREFLDAAAEMGWITGKAKELHSAGVAWEEIAVLYRINARSEAFEEAFSKAGIPYQVADSPFLRRPGPRSVIHRLRAGDRPDVAAAVEEAVRALGFREDNEETEGEEVTRQADLGRLLLMAREYPGGGVVADFIADLVARFTEEDDGRGVQLLTYHRAKGKEFDAVFLPRLEEKELPFALAKSDEQLAEERRLFYVGMTRAKRFLSITWALAREGEKRSRPKPSQFLQEARPAPEPSAHPTRPTPNLVAQRTKVTLDDPESSALFETLKKWRIEVAKEREVPAYVVFHDSTLASIAETKPTTPEQLLAIKGIGPAKYTDYGSAVLELIGNSKPAA
jgi:ATP-dependent DNA helicase UvrD/PcrA